MSLRGRAEEHLGADRDKTAAQKGPERGCIARGNLREHGIARLDQSQPLSDQTPTLAPSAPTRLEQFHRQFLAINEASPDRDDAQVVSMHSDIAPVGPRPDHSGVAFVVDRFGESTTAGSVSHEHDIVRTDPAIGACQPAQDIGL